MFEFRGLHPNPRGFLCLHVSIFSSLLVWSSQEAAAFVSLHSARSFSVVSAAAGRASCAMCRGLCSWPWDDTRESFRLGRGLRFVSASHPFRCRYHDRIVYSFHITWLMPWWCSWALRQSVAILRTRFRKKERKEICPRGSFSNNSWCFSVQVSRFAILTDPARPLQQAD